MTWWVFTFIILFLEIKNLQPSPFSSPNRSRFSAVCWLKSRHLPGKKLKSTSNLLTKLNVSKNAWKKKKEFLHHNNVLFLVVSKWTTREPRLITKFKEAPFFTWFWRYAGDHSRCLINCIVILHLATPYKRPLMSWCKCKCSHLIWRWKFCCRLVYLLPKTLESLENSRPTRQLKWITVTEVLFGYFPWKLNFRR